MSADALPSHYVHQLMYRERWCYLSLLPGPHLQAWIKPLCTIAEHFFFIAVQCKMWHFKFLILAYIGLVNIRIFKNGTISLPKCPSDQGNHRLLPLQKNSAVWHGVLDVFISAFLWVLLKLIVRAFRPGDHDRAADDLSLPLCAKPSTSSYNHRPIVFVFIIAIGSFLYYCQYLYFMLLDPSRKYT